MKKIIVLLFALALIFSPRFVFAVDKGLHLGGLDKDAKKAKIEAKKSAQQSGKDAEKAKKQTQREAERKKKEAEIAKKKAQRQAEQKKKRVEKEFNKEVK